MKIISPKYDYVVKELFRNQIILRYFIGDILEIPQTQIHTVRLKNPFLWKRYKLQKLGILDLVAELNDDTKINIELQVKIYDNWDKRQLFYLAKLFTEDLLSGQDYSQLKKCVGISILNFNLNDRKNYHSVYRLRDREGNELSDILEFHVLELKKELTGKGEVDNWIRFFNVETKEDLNMIKTKNPGILEAIGELRRLSLNNPLRIMYEAYLKKIRDERAWKAHVWKEAWAVGRANGRAEGKTEGKIEGKIEGRAEGKIEGRAEGKIEGRTEGKIEGKIESKAEDILDLLQINGKVPYELRERIWAEKDVDKLRQWLKLAAKSNSIDDFLEKIRT